MTHAFSKVTTPVRYGNEDAIDVYAKVSSDVMDNIINGRITFQRAFMTGSMTAKGNFKTLRMLIAK